LLINSEDKPNFIGKDIAIREKVSSNVNINKIINFPENKSYYGFLFFPKKFQKERVSEARHKFKKRQVVEESTKMRSSKKLTLLSTVEGICSVVLSKTFSKQFSSSSPSKQSVLPSQTISLEMQHVVKPDDSAIVEHGN